MNIQMLLFWAALVFFLLDGLQIKVEHVSWTPLGYAALVAALFLL